MELRRHKYQISNEEMQKIVKDQVEHELKDIIELLGSDLQFVQGQNL